MKVAFIDNYDSFSYNLIQTISALNLHSKLQVWQNDELSLDQLKHYNPNCVIISPGPGNPDSAGISLECVSCYYDKASILGVCLGHQVIAQSFGAEISKANKPLHGMTSKITHNYSALYQNVPSPTEVMRYHSLIVKKESMPCCLEITARSEEDEVMSISHKDYPIFGVQFHPESFQSQYGVQVLKNFLTIAANNIR